MAASEKKLVRSKSGLRIIAKKDSERSPFELHEPAWVPDNECLVCIECGEKFDFMNRRHHCRRCGRCFCSKCCSHKELLTRMCFVDPVRQCARCAQATGKENEFFDKHVKILTNGASFNVASSLTENENENYYFCKLSSDQRMITFECDSQIQNPAPLVLNQIRGVQILTSQSNEGMSVPSGMCIRYTDVDADVQNVKLVGVEGPEKKQAMLWVAAMQKAAKMLLDKHLSDTP